MNKKISIVIITKDTKELLRGLLDSIKNDLSLQPYIGKIIIVDNASTDSTEEMIREEFPTVVYVRNERNMGFAFSADRGSSLAEDEYVLFLNSDTVLIQGELEKMVCFMDSNTDVGICGPQLVYLDMKPQRSSAAVPSLWGEILPQRGIRVQGSGLRGRSSVPSFHNSRPSFSSPTPDPRPSSPSSSSSSPIHDSLHLDAPYFPLPAQDSSSYSPIPDPHPPSSGPTPPSSISHLPDLGSSSSCAFPASSFQLPASRGLDIPSLIGAAILVRREMLKAIDGFDERFFFFLEETDLCVRVWQAGHRVVFFPEARIIHLQGKTVRKSWISGRMEYNISLHKFIKKHHAPVYYGIFVAVRFTKALFLSVLFPLAFSGERMRMKYAYYVRLISWYFRGCPDNAGLRPGKDAQRTAHSAW